MGRVAKAVSAPQSLLEKIGPLLIEGARPFTPVLTGALLTSERYVITGSSSVSLVADVPYAHFVHDGTSRMAARPFFDQAIKDKDTEVDALFRQWGERLLDTVGRG